jgi:hypothetical protein
LISALAIAGSINSESKQVKFLGDHLPPHAETPQCLQRSMGQLDHPYKMKDLPHFGHHQRAGAPKLFGEKTVRTII